LSLQALRGRLDRVAREMLPVSFSEGAPTRNARRLATIAAEAEGPRRDVVVMMMVHSACGIEEPADYHALVDAIGPEAIARAFPTGIPVQTACADVRARVRAYRPVGGEFNPLTVMLTDAIKRETWAAARVADGATS